MPILRFQIPRSLADFNPNWTIWTYTTCGFSRTAYLPHSETHHWNTIHLPDLTVKVTDTNHSKMEKKSIEKEFPDKHIWKFILVKKIRIHHSEPKKKIRELYKNYLDFHYNNFISHKFPSFTFREFFEIFSIGNDIYSISSEEIARYYPGGNRWENLHYYPFIREWDTAIAMELVNESSVIF